MVGRPAVFGPGAGGLGSRLGWTVWVGPRPCRPRPPAPAVGTEARWLGRQSSGSPTWGAVSGSRGLVTPVQIGLAGLAGPCPNRAPLPGPAFRVRVGVGAGRAVPGPGRRHSSGSGPVGPRTRRGAGGESSASSSPPSQRRRCLSDSVPVPRSASLASGGPRVELEGYSKQQAVA